MRSRSQGSSSTAPLGFSHDRHQSSAARRIDRRSDRLPLAEEGRRRGRAGRHAGRARDRQDHGRSAGDERGRADEARARRRRRGEGGRAVGGDRRECGGRRRTGAAAAAKPLRAGAGSASQPAEPAPAPPRRTYAGTCEPAAAEVRASPAAQRVAAERGVDLVDGQGTGRGGVVSKPDVIDASATQGSRAANQARRAAAAPSHRVRPASRFPRPASARRARRCRRAASASPSICSSRSTPRRTSRRSTRST